MVFVVIKIITQKLEIESNHIWNKENDKNKEKDNYKIDM